MAQKISQMTEQTTASMTEAGTSDFLGGYTTTGGNANRKFSLSGLANYFLNKFKMTLGGSSQTVKSAIDALNSNVNIRLEVDFESGSGAPSVANMERWLTANNDSLANLNGLCKIISSNHYAIGIGVINMTGAHYGALTITSFYALKGSYSCASDVWSHD